MKIKISEATKLQLDYLVALATNQVNSGVYGEPAVRDGFLHINYCGYVLDAPWTPTTSWAHGGPIIEQERVVVEPWGLGWMASTARCILHHGPTPLIATMRAYVVSKLGDEVEIPEDLA